jgi:pimeloyl-ACP methyl ester carboxylesterase
MAQAMRAALADEPEVKHVTIVGHSLGAAMAMRMLSDGPTRERYRDVLDRVDGLVLISPLDVRGIEKVSESMIAMTKLTGLEVALGSATGELRRRAEVGLAESVGTDTPLLREEVDILVSILEDPRRRHATQATLLAVAPSRSADSYRPDWDRIEKGADGSRPIDVRTLIVCGDRDETLPMSMGYKLWAQIPRSELYVFRNTKHSPHLEAPAGVVSLVREFVAPGSTIASLAHESPARFVGRGQVGGGIGDGATK